MARPKFEINYETVEGLASILCTQEEIASVLGCSVDTLQRDKKFKEVYKRGMDLGRSSLRRLQFEQAQRGNVTMQIWLGKNLLKQTDKTDLTPDGDDDVDPLNIVYNVKPAKREVKVTKGKG